MCNETSIKIMRNKEITITIVTGVIVLTAAIIFGIRVHNEITPDIVGTFSGTVTVDGFPWAKDSYNISENKSIYLTREIMQDGMDAPAQITAKGKWKETLFYYNVKMDKGDASYNNDFRLFNKRGREIAPKKLIDKRFLIPKSQIEEGSIVIQMRRENASGEEIQVEYTLTKTEE